ncbi:hypothetical protein TCAL_11853 [Tigriopus californicus]|uniref:Serine-threonine/tyrosine-protein kinase catalytic domain-containing protein n=1 Tax=Tigriopus californicus TaxID=6832 RepID=A0A553PGJ5_TIGCA|nr:hypothetical protein TCAL_11853 [Tigriopus californicus]
MTLIISSCADGPSSEELAEKLKAGLRLKIPSYPANDGNEKSLNALYSIMLHCWQLDPCSRPAFDVLHEDFANFDIAIEEKYYHSPREVLDRSGFFTRMRRKKRAKKR